MKKPQQVWLLWQKAKAVGHRPSALLSIDPVEDSYLAYCVDEAVVYFGIMLENELQSAGQKPGKEERRAQLARERILARVFGDGGAKKQYADPAAMFR